MFPWCGQGLPVRSWDLKQLSTWDLRHDGCRLTQTLPPDRTSAIVITQDVLAVYTIRPNVQLADDLFTDHADLIFTTNILENALHKYHSKTSGRGHSISVLDVPEVTLQAGWGRNVSNSNSHWCDSCSVGSLLVILNWDLFNHFE